MWIIRGYTWGKLSKEEFTAQERAESAIQSTIDATLAKIKTVLDRYYQDMPNNFSQAENYFTGYVAAFDIKDGIGTWR